MPIRTLFTWIFLRNCPLLHLDVSHMNVVYIVAKATEHVTNVTILRIILTCITYSIENKLIFRKKKYFLILNISISIMKFISRDVRIHIFIDSIIFIRNWIKTIET